MRHIISLNETFRFQLFDLFIFYFCCVLGVLMTWHCAYFFIRLLYTFIYIFLLSVGCAFCSIFLSWDAKRIISVCFLFQFFRLADWNMTWLNLMVTFFDLVHKWIKFEVLYNLVVLLILLHYKIWLRGNQVQLFKKQKEKKNEATDSHI